MQLFTRPIVLWFTTEPGAVEYAVNSMGLPCYGFIFPCFGIAIIQALNAAGDTITPTWINVFCF